MYTADLMLQSSLHGPFSCLGSQLRSSPPWRGRGGCRESETGWPGIQEAGNIYSVTSSWRHLKINEMVTRASRVKAKIILLVKHYNYTLTFTQGCLRICVFLSSHQKNCKSYIRYRSNVWGHRVNLMFSMKTHFYLSNELQNE